VKLATFNPARMQGLKTTGVLAEGMDADLTVFDREVNIKLTMVAGEVKFKG
ncbi:MAG TPA: amidohydrolase family protein, partial [Firmicutes bacterium]|nr:amidohydrolase family protein [Bacillota bacterium]